MAPSPHDPGSCLHMRLPIRDDARADRDREVHAPVARRDVPDRSRVRPAAFGLEFVDDLHRANLRCAGHRAGRERRRGTHRSRWPVGSSPSTWLTICSTWQYRSTANSSVTSRCRSAPRAPHRCGRGPPASRARRAPSRRRAARPRASHRPPRSRPRGRVPAIGRTVTRPSATRTSSSGELPTSSSPSSTKWYMYGDGLSTRSAR